MDLKLDGEAMQALVAKTLVDSFTPEKRDELIQNAIKAILEAPKRGETNFYGKKESVFQSAFENAAGIAANRIITGHLTNDADFSAKAKALIAEATEHAFNVEGGGREKMVKAISDAIVAGLRPQERY